LALAGLALCPGLAEAACRAEALCQTYHHYAAVFEGTVTSARQALLTFRVERSWKGVSPGGVEIVPTGRRVNRADVAPGRRYLVLASRGTGDRLTADGCAIKPVEAAVADARFLESLARPSRGGRLEIHIDDGLRRLEPDAGPGPYVLTIDGPVRRVIDTGGGRVQMVDLPAGRYRVYLRLPSELETWTPLPVELELPDAHACPLGVLAVRPSTSVRGTVLRADGRPASGIPASLTKPSW
jgi:hypothetical protein